MENGITTAMICLDLSAAFDTVNHHILKLIMENHFDIESTALKWISSYSENRQFVVQIYNSISAIKEVNQYVPQGSLLGPVVFSCYVSTLHEKITKDQSSVLFGYADDHILAYSFRPENTQAKLFLENTIEEIRIWMYTNHLCINDIKMELIFFTSKKPTTSDIASIQVGHTEVQGKDSVQLMGTNLDKKLTLKANVQARTKTALYNISLKKSGIYSQ